MEAKPILFLDVDGVLNACPPLPGHTVVQKEGFPICIPEGTKERLARLLEVFEPCWATTWREHAHPNFGADLDLGETWPHITHDPLMRISAWKLPAILEYAGSRRWVWIDDDGMWEVEEYRRNNLADDGAFLANGLILCPETRQGMTDIQVEQALAFVGGQDG